MAVPSGTEAARAFIPAKDFDSSKAFYEALGFKTLLDGDVAIFGVGASALILQRYYKKEWAENCMMQMMVDNSTHGGSVSRLWICRRCSVFDRRRRQPCSLGDCASVTFGTRPACFGMSLSAAKIHLRIYDSTPGLTASRARAPDSIPVTIAARDRQGTTECARRRSGCRCTATAVRRGILRGWPERPAAASAESARAGRQRAPARSRQAVQMPLPANCQRLRRQ